MAWRRFVGFLVFAVAFVPLQSPAIALGDHNFETNAQTRNLVLQDILGAETSLESETELLKATNDAGYTPETACTFLIRSSNFDAGQLQNLIHTLDFTECQSNTTSVNMATTKVLIREGQPVSEHIVVVVFR